MNKKIKTSLLFLLSFVVLCCVALLAACAPNDSGDGDDEYDGLFSGDSHTYSLSEDYTITSADVKGTKGDDNVTLDYICSFNLNGHTLDLGGYTLNVTSSASNEVVKFENGKIRNGKLNVTVPNGDIQFTGTTIDESVTYELEAASETITFSNARISGKCTVKSNTHVFIEQSNVGDIALAGNGRLTAGTGAELGSVTVSESASGATVDISADARADKVQLNAAANVQVSGTVSSVKVDEVVKNDSASLSINVAKTAQVTKVELHAAASVQVEGTVAAVTVSEAVKNDSANLSINVGAEATVDTVELKAPASVEVSGGVSNILVTETAGGANVTLNETAYVTTVAVKASDITIDSNENASVSKIVVNESVADSISVSDNINVSTATDEEMEEFFQHKHVMVVESREEPTCTEDGKVVLACDCGEKVEQTIPALGHLYTYEVVQEPTENEKGLGRYTCTRCRHSYTEEIEYSVSLVIDGLNYLFSQIPDGTYSLSVGDDGFVIDQGSRGTGTLSDTELVIEVENGNVQGTASGQFVVPDEIDVRFKMVIDNNVVHCYFYEVMDGSNSVEGGVHATISACLSMYFSMAGIDVSGNAGDYSAIANLIDKIDLKDKFTGELINKIINGIADVTESGENTVYALNGEKIAESLTSLGEMKVKQFICEIIGNDAYDELVDIADGIADKTVLTLAAKVYDFAEKYGISQDMIFDVAQTVFNEVAKTPDFDVKQFVESNYTKKLATAISDFTGGQASAAEIKVQIESTVEHYIALANTYSVKQLANELLAANGSEMTFENVLSMVNEYSQCLTLSVTLNADNIPVAFEVAFDGGEDMAVSIVKTQDSYIPTINVVLNAQGIAGSLEKTETGFSAVATVMDMQFALSGDKSEEDYVLGFTMEGPAANSEFNITATPKKDAQDSVYGADINVQGNVTSDYYDINITGDLILQKNDALNIDGSIWDSFEGDKSMFRHITVNGDRIKLEYVTDSTGEYYLLTYTGYERMSGTSLGSTFMGTLYKYESTVKLLSIDGLPEILIPYEADCGDWIHMGIVYSGSLECKTTVMNGVFKRVGDDYVPVGNPSIEDMGTEKRVESISEWIYYNPKTGAVANESQHSYKYTAIDGTNCETGLRVKGVCEHCGSEIYSSNGSHFYEYDRHSFTTQCGDNDYIEIGTCIADGYQVINTDFYNHTFSRSNYRIISDEEYEARKEQYEGASEEELDKILGNYIRLSELEDLGFDIQGFYYGNLERRHCAYCGLNVYNYVYYTNTSADGCLEHRAYYVQYSGNSSFEDFTYTVEISNEGHYTVGRDVEITASAATALVTDTIGESLPVTFEYANRTNYTCAGCATVTSTEIQLHSENSGEAYLWIYYVEGTNTIDRWHFELRVRDAEVVLSEARNVAPDYVPEGEVISGEYWYNIEDYGGVGSENTASESRIGNSDYAEAEISHKNKHFELMYANGDELDLNLYGSKDFDEMQIEKYTYSECSQVHSYYEKVNGVWNLRNSDRSERHAYSGSTRYGDNCREDGYEYSHRCEVCGQGETNVGYAHQHINFGQYECPVQQIAEYISETDLAGLNATASFSNVCENCRTFIDVTIVLRSDWTLQNDVYIKAEGLTLDLNGCFIDLNGYNLILYSYAGELLVLTDSSFDTSSLEDETPDNPVNPETPAEPEIPAEPGRIINSNEERGALVAVSQNILPGTISIEVQSLFSDTDDRYSLAAAFQEQFKYELAILNATRPSWYTGEKE